MLQETKMDIEGLLQLLSATEGVKKSHYYPFVAEKTS